MPRNATKITDCPVTIVGMGAVGSALARAAKAASFSCITLVGKGHPGEQRLDRALKVGHLRHVTELQQEQGFIILAVREAQIAAVVHDLTSLLVPWWKVTVLHTSGPLGAEILCPLASLGAGVAAWHPYQTFPRRAKRGSLQGVTFGTDGNRKGILAANRLTRALGGLPLRVPEQDRLLYHLSAVLSCGFVAADLQMATEVLKKIGVSDRRALQTVLPIARETLKQVGELGVRSAMTGPAVRGDLATIQRHLAALMKAAPEMLRVYAAVTDWVLGKSLKA